MRLLPRSMSGQLLALLLLAMLVVHVVAVVVLQWWNADSDRIHPLSAHTIETRVASAYSVAAEHPAEADTLLQSISLPESRFHRRPSAVLDGAGMDRQEQALAQALRDRLQLPAGTAVHVDLRHASATSPMHEQDVPLSSVSDLLAPQWELIFEVRLPDGGWLSSRNLPTIVPGHWSRVLSFSLPVSVLPMTIIAIFFGRRIMRPLKRLTQAAQRISRGQTDIALPPEGPEGVREITQAFNDMQERLSRFINGRTQMIAAMGHDLRTPLTSLRIQTALIEDEALGAQMARTLDEMAAMVDETLRFARDDAAQEATEDVDLAALVAGVVAHHRIAGRAVHMAPTLPMAYRCRPGSLKRAIDNLIDNAARHGAVSVRLSSDSVGRLVRIDIDDEGPGIAEDQLEQAFEPFVRLDSARNQESGGSGLGLAIARSSVRAHGGEVMLRNKPGGGLTASIQLPV